MFIRLISIGFVLLFLSAQCPKKNEQSKLSPELQKALNDFDIAEGFNIELVVAEPLISDPVAMEIDEEGRIYVVEMHGYPLDLAGSGKIKLLSDTDGDGFPDKSTVFADKLVLPTGIMRWKKGFLVTDAPDVLYLEDTNGDGKADIRKTVLTGFALSNPQHNLNTPVLGLDNWIYLGHQYSVTPTVCKEQFSDKGSNIRFPDNSKAPQLSANADGRNVRFKPDSYELETLSAATQYGQTFDPWGHHFLTENAHHIFHEVLSARYLSRNPNVLISNTIQSNADHGNACEVFPTTLNPAHQLLTDVGVITSACGITWYDGGAFPKVYQNATFVAEPVHNLVHVDAVRDSGSSFVASRILEKKDFLTSKDAWFRPVQFYVGPDGALYVVDYYRQIVEHPEWMSDEINKSGALYNGTDKGRIYRITPKAGLPMNWLGKLNLSQKSDKELVQLLENKNNWWRKTAHRLLVERQSKTIADIRQVALKSKNAEARVHALWILDGLKSLDQTVLKENLSQNTECGVRENTIKIIEKNNQQNSELITDLLALQNDSSPKVRFQLICTLGLLPPSEAIDKAIRRILFRDIQDKWVQIAAICSSSGREMPLLKWALNEFKDDNSKATAQLFNYLSTTLVNDPKQVEALIDVALIPSTKSTIGASILSGIFNQLSKKGIKTNLSESLKNKLLSTFNETADPSKRNASLRLLSLSGLPILPKNYLNSSVLNIAKSINNAEAFRADAVYFLSFANKIFNKEQFQIFANSKESEKVQLAALEMMNNKTADKLPCQYILSDWKQRTPDVQNKAIDVFLKRSEWSHLLLDALSKGIVTHEQLGWRRTSRLMGIGDLALRAHAREVLAKGGLAREAILRSYQPSLNLTGNPLNGKKVFEMACATCHKINETGIDFGPELGSLRNRPANNILESIILPNKTIADMYETWHVELKNGKTVEGIITDRTSSSYTLKMMGGQEQIITKKEVKNMKALSTSSMPEGLENAISLTEMADLLACIKDLK
jgi:putative membrane-bound dehydrogenase-like protein